MLYSSLNFTDILYPFSLQKWTLWWCTVQPLCKDVIFIWATFTFIEDNHQYSLCVLFYRFKSITSSWEFSSTSTSFLMRKLSINCWTANYYACTSFFLWAVYVNVQLSAIGYCFYRPNDNGIVTRSNLIKKKLYVRQHVIFTYFKIPINNCVSNLPDRLQYNTVRRNLATPLTTPLPVRFITFHHLLRTVCKGHAWFRF